MRSFAITLVLAVVVLSPSIFLGNINNYLVYALKKPLFSSSSSPISPLKNGSDAIFYKTIDGQRNRCHNDNNLNAVVCEQ